MLRCNMKSCRHCAPFGRMAGVRPHDVRRPHPPSSFPAYSSADALNCSATIIAGRSTMPFRPLIAALACVGFPLLAIAQTPQLKLPPFANLQQKATESVDITIGSLALGIMSGLMDEHDEDSAEMKQLITGLKSVQVRNYRFDSDFAYSKTDIDAVRSQLSAPVWTQLAQVHDQKKNEDVGVYVALDDHKVTGFAIVASEPREFTIINIVGAVDLDKVAALQKQLGLPDVGAARIPPYIL